MSKLKEIIAYFCKNYPHPSEISKARLTKMVYLADWKSALDRDKQITDIDWLFNHYGPFVDDVADIVMKDQMFELHTTANAYGGTKYLIEIKNKNYNPDLSRAEKDVLDHVIDSTSKLYWNTFINLVYSTYPVAKSNRYDKLDLPKLARQYKEMTQEIVSS